MVSSSRLTCISECSHSGGVVGHELHQLEADVCQVERLAGVREVDCCIHVAGEKLSLSVRGSGLLMSLEDQR